MHGSHFFPRTETAPSPPRQSLLQIWLTRTLPASRVTIFLPSLPARALPGALRGVGPYVRSTERRDMRDSIPTRLTHSLPSLGKGRASPNLQRVTRRQASHTGGGLAEPLPIHPLGLPPPFPLGPGEHCVGGSGRVRGGKDRRRPEKLNLTEPSQLLDLLFLGLG